MQHLINSKICALDFGFRTITVLFDVYYHGFYKIEGNSARISWNRQLHLCDKEHNKSRGIEEKEGHNQARSCVILSNAIKLNSKAAEDGWLGRRPDGRQLFEKMPERSLAVSNSMISRYARMGKMEHARNVFDKLPERNVVSWNSMIAGYAQNGSLKDARQMFDEMPQRDVVSWNGMIAGYLQNGRVEEGWALFDSMPERNEVSWITMIAGIAQNRRLEDARLLFDEMPERHVRAWNAMIAGYAQCDQCGDSVRIFREMLRCGTVPNAFTFPSVMRACTGLVAVELGKQIHACVAKAGIQSDVFVGSSLVTMYAKCGMMDHACKVMNGMPRRDLAMRNAMLAGFVQNGRMEEAHKLFEDLLHKNVVSWTAMIAGYAQNGQCEKAIVYFIKMLREGIKANQATLTSVLRACANLAALEQGKQVHARNYKTMFDYDIVVNNALVTMYAKCGSIQDADEVFSSMAERDVVSWNAMIRGYAQHGYAKEALKLFEELLHTGSKPDEITFVCVLSACSHAGLVNKGWYYFNSMVQEHCLMRGPEHYACMVDLLGRAGHLDEAEDLINKMDVKPDAVIWGSLLSACKIHVNVELGKRAAEHLFEMEPDNDSTYVLLSSIYSAASMWDDARKVRIMMKNKGIKKTPGCSWLDVRNRIHVFVTEDRSHPETEKIYEKLNELAKRLEEAGYVPETRVVLEDVAEDEKEHILYHHSEKLAVAFGLLSAPCGKPIHVIKNLRVCGDCHTAIKFIAKITDQEIVLRDTSRYHHFKDGFCSCGDYW